MNFDENLADFGCCLEEEGSMSKNAAAFLKAYARTSTVLNAAAEFQQVLQKEELVRKYLDFCYEGQGGLKYQAKNAVDFGFKDGKTPCYFLCVLFLAYILILFLFIRF